MKTQTLNKEWIVKKYANISLVYKYQRDTACTSDQQYDEIEDISGLIYDTDIE